MKTAQKRRLAGAKRTKDSAADTGNSVRTAIADRAHNGKSDGDEVSGRNEARPTDAAG